MPVLVLILAVCFDIQTLLELHHWKLSLNYKLHVQKALLITSKTPSEVQLLRGLNKNSASQ